MRPTPKLLDLHGKSGDALVVFMGVVITMLSNIVTAVEKGMLIVLLSAADDDLLTEQIGGNGIEISTAEFGKSSTISAGFLVLQCLCALIDNKIFGRVNATISHYFNQYFSIG